MKTCTKCNISKELTEFYLNRAMTDGHLNECIACKKLYVAEWREANRDQVNAGRRKRYRHDPSKYQTRRMKEVYNLTPEQYVAILEKQKHLCAVCGKPGELVIDHNHETGKVRGLLHGTCNSALGLLKDSPEIALGAASYLALDGIT